MKVILMDPISEEDVTEMETFDHESPTEHPGRLAGLRTSSRAWLKRNVLLQTLLVVIALTAFVFGVLFVKQDRADDRARAEQALQAKRDAYTAAFASYSAEIQAWQANHEIYNGCVVGIKTRDSFRAVLFDFANGFVEVLPGEPLAVEYRDARVKFFDDLFPPKLIADCGEEPVAPIPPPLPEGIDPPILNSTATVDTEGEHL